MQLGRILLQQEVVTQDELDELLEQQRLHPGERIASAVARSGRLTPPRLLRALSEQQGVPAIDLTQISIPLDHLSLVPRDVAREHLILPLLVKEDRLFLAMADPHHRRIIDEIEFVTGKRIQPYVALHGVLLEVIDQAYAAAEGGEEVFVPPPELGSLRRQSRAAPPPVASLADELAPGTPGVVSAEPPEEAPAAPLTVTADSQRRPCDSLAMEPAPPIPDGPELDAAFGPSEPPRAPSQPPAGAKGKVLVVDDSEDIRRLLVRVLREKDYDVIEADNGATAISLVRESTPDVLLLDAMLPEIHGFDICRRIKGSRRFGHIPVIMVSAVYRGWRFAEDLRRSYGVDQFLEKPFRIGEVLAAVETCLAGTPVDAEPPEALEGEVGEALEAGIAAYAAGDVQVAIQHLKRGIGVDPLAFRLHYHLGLLYGKQERLFEAIQTLETAADLRPRDFSTLKNLAVLYQRAGFRLKATEMWERAMGSSPDEGTKEHIKKHLMSLLQDDGPEIG